MLLDGLTQKEIEEIYERSKLQLYDKDRFVFETNDQPTHLNLLVEGEVCICDYDENGNKKIITIIDQKGDVFGEVFLFMNAPYYGHFALTMTTTQVLRIPKNVVYGHVKLMFKFASVFATKAFLLNQRVHLLSCATLRDKIMLYLKYYCDKNHTLYLNQTRDEWADFLNVKRPSLSRELMKMQEEQILTVEGKKITLHS